MRHQVLKHRNEKLTCKQKREIYNNRISFEMEMLTNSGILSYKLSERKSTIKSYFSFHYTSLESLCVQEHKTQVQTGYA